MSCEPTKILLKCACSQEEVVQLGHVSRGFGCHADGYKVIIVNLSYLVHNVQVFYHTRQISGFPCVTLYINSKEVVQMRCYIIITSGVELVKLVN